ncbi:hypothetical protein pb186bvf_006506 [Paramecium bursaria]
MEFLQIYFGLQQWQGPNIIQSGIESVKYLIKSQKQVFFLTNNSTKSRVSYQEILSGLGVNVDLKYIYSSSYLVAAYLQSQNKIKAFNMGMNGLTEELSNLGIKVVESSDMAENVAINHYDFMQMEVDKEIDAVVTGFNNILNYRMVCYGNICLDQGAILVAANPDRFVNIGSRKMPAGGCVQAIMEKASGKNAVVVGKPSSTALQLIMQQHGIQNKQKILMIGDNEETDIQFAIDSNISSLLVTTGQIPYGNREALIQYIHINHIFLIRQCKINIKRNLRQETTQKLNILIQIMGVCSSQETQEQKKEPTYDSQINHDTDEDEDLQEANQITLDDSNKKIGLQDFEFIKVLGRGSFGKVVLIRKKDSQELYAVKILRKSLLTSQKSKQNALQEKRILQKINSDFVVKLHFAFQSSTRLYMVLDFMIGGELFLHLRLKQRFNEQTTQFYAAEILHALSVLHNHGVVYRDLKPENVLLDESGHIKLTDFGLSKLGYETDQTINSFCGTPEYVAPEVLYQKGYNHTVDFYSLGALIFEMLSGAPPHYNKNKKQMLQDRCNSPLELKGYFSMQAQNLLRGLLCRDPQRRLGRNSVEEIKNHNFFQGIDWKIVEARQLVPPIVPRVRFNGDLGNFAQGFTKMPIEDTPVQKLDEHYEGFSYVTNY